MTAPTAPKHTPGPWLLDRHLGSLSYVRAASGELIASCSWKHGQQDVPAIKNARLIAAAPGLLDSLIWARQELLGCGGYINENAITAIDAAIAAATGEVAA